MTPPRHPATPRRAATQSKATMTPAQAARLERDKEQAIMLTLLEIPAFRKRAGLPPRKGGSTLDEMGRVLGVTRERIRLIEQSAMKKIRRRIDPTLIYEIQRAGY